MLDNEATGSNSNNTLLNTTSQRIGTSGKEIEVPKLKVHECEDYIRWKWELEWWEEVTKIDKRSRRAHVVLNGLANARTKDVAAKLQTSRVATEDGVIELLKHLDKHFLPNTFARKMAASSRQKKTEKTDNMTWEDFLIKMRKWRQDLESYGVVVPEEMYCIAWIESSNLDRNVKVHLEGMARAAPADRKTIESEKLEEIMMQYDNKNDDGQDINYADYTEEQLEEEIDETKLVVGKISRKKQFQRN